MLATASGPFGVEEALRAARVFLARGFCQHAEARDAAGRPAHPTSLRARSWSVTGALYAGVRFDGSPERRAVYQLATSILAEVLGSPPGAWNDAPGRTRVQAMAVLEEALRLVTGEAWHTSAAGAAPA